VIQPDKSDISVSLSLSLSLYLSISLFISESPAVKVTFITEWRKTLIGSLWFVGGWAGPPSRCP